MPQGVVQCIAAIKPLEGKMLQSVRAPKTPAVIAMNVDKIMRSSRRFRTQQRLADASGLSQSHLSRILSGRYKGTKVAALEAIAKATGHDVWELFIED